MVLPPHLDIHIYESEANFISLHKKEAVETAPF